jgi:hypothetical protein
MKTGLPENLREQALGEDTEQYSLGLWGENREAALALARQARRSIQIFSHDLEPTVYEHQPFIQAILDLARSGRGSRVQILLHDSERVVKYGHRLVEAAQRLPSSIEIRRPGKGHQDYPQAFLLADQRGLLRRKLSTRPESILAFNAPLEARKLSDFFTSVWDLGASDPELRRLDL